MRNKRKEILRDLLGEFGSEDGESDESENPEEKTYEEPVKEQSEEFKYVPEKLEPPEDLAINPFLSDKSKQDTENTSTESYMPRKIERKEERPSFFDDDEGGYKLDSIMGSEPAVDKVIDKPKRRTKKIKKMGEGIKAEIIEEGLIPSYNVNVPKFTERERQLLNEIREKLVEVAVSQGESFNIEESSFIGEVKEFLKMKGIRDTEKLAAQISQEMLGYAQLDPMIKDDDLEEIMVIGVNKPVFVYHRKIGMMKTNVVFDDDGDARAIIDVIARQVNRRIDQQTPILDARLGDGSRVNATIPPVSADGSTLTIRKFRKDPLTVIDLINFKTLSSHLAGFYGYV